MQNLKNSLLFPGQKGIAHPLIILVLLAGLGIGVFLVSQRTNILPHAQQEVIGPQTAFYLFLSENYPRGETAVVLDGKENPAERNWFYEGEEIKVDVAVSTDIDYSNVFNANISYPNDLLEVTSLKLNSIGNETVSQESTSGGEAKLKISAVSQKSSARPSKKPEICAQVVTRACKLDKVICVKAPCPPRKICKDFPTPCDVPEGWNIEKPGIKPPPSDCSKVACQLGIPDGCSVEKDGSCCGKIVCPGSPIPVPTCRPRPACLDSEPRCLLPETNDMCPPAPGKVGNYFIKYWVEQNFDNSAGTISLVGGVPEKGIKTSPPGKPIMAMIIFKAKKAGNPEVKFNDTSAIIRASDNTNILTTRKNLAITIKDKDILQIPGDIDGDGKVGLKDLSALLSKWGTDDKNADLNGDGKVNIYDFSVLLSNWGRP